METMIAVLLSNEAYKNDIAEEIRLFLGNVPIAFEKTPEAVLTIEISLLRGNGTVRADARAEGRAAEFTAALPETDALTVKRYEKRAAKIAAFRLLKQLYSASTPWGSLTGIRPTKLMRELTERAGGASARETFLKTFDVSEEKTRLCQSICGVQAGIIAGIQPRGIDLYFGVPYCKTRCLYCSFGTELARNANELEAYLEVLKRDIAYSAAIVHDAGLKVRASYFGGGTPSILSASQIDRFLSCAVRSYGGFGRECTFEAGRPDTITAEKLSVLRDYGVRRISINPQTMNDKTLFRIGRRHTAKDIENAYALARNLGFTEINMDLIIGLPGETAQDVQNSVERVLALAPENVTVHTLAIKRSSKLKAQLESYPMVPPDEADEMVRLCRARCEDAGLLPYYLYRQKYMQGNLENVGYARPDTACLYNVDIMEELTSIMAHGAGAISKRVYEGDARIERVPNPKDVKTYREKLTALASSKKALFCD